MNVPRNRPHSALESDGIPYLRIKIPRSPTVPVPQNPEILQQMSPSETRKNIGMHHKYLRATTGQPRDKKLVVVETRVHPLHRDPYIRIGGVEFFYQSEGSSPIRTGKHVPPTQFLHPGMRLPLPTRPENTQKHGRREKSDSRDGDAGRSAHGAVEPLRQL